MEIGRQFSLNSPEANVALSETCPLCRDSSTSLIGLHADDKAASRLRREHPEWFAEQGACTRCVDYGNLLLLDERSVAQSHRTTDGYLVLPTPARLDAIPILSGKGVTICFIDSGFAPHPDLTTPKNRILCAVDITKSDEAIELVDDAHDDNWHGTMTSVVCAGNGAASGGVYRGIASEANLVLLKVKNDYGIAGEFIVKAIRWAIAHKQEYNIRIINLSVTDDEPISYRESAVDQAAEDAVAAGILVVAAIGNDIEGSVKPPANSPNVIAVGGLNDHNSLGMVVETAYHSTFGTTIDDFLKPELIAPAIWLAAPILPYSAAHREAKSLYAILASDDRSMENILAKEIDNTAFDFGMLMNSPPEAIRQHIVQRIIEAKYISPDYQHADGTSFAAPIVCSIIAQMLEANPSLAPRAARQMLLATARTLRDVPRERQGFGVINAREAVNASLREAHSRPEDYPDSPVIDWFNQRIIFYYHNDEASSVALAGSFNDWKPNAMLFKKNGRGVWKAEISMLPKGTHFYRFVIDNKTWIADPENSHREHDGFGGVNSKVTIG